MMRIFIGYDPRQPVSYTVLQHSIIVNAKKPVSITPLILDQLPMTRQGLTPFTWSRFLVPWLSGFQGWSLFLDIDMLVRGDISELFDLAEPGCAVMVSKNKLKFEWASAMLFDCGHYHNRKLTPEFVQSTELSLHKIEWTDRVGEFPGEWNHLVGYDEPNPDAKLVHFTQGVPAYPETVDCEHAQAWQETGKEAMASVPWVDLMGRSVHAKPVVDRLTRDGKLDQMAWQIA